MANPFDQFDAATEASVSNPFDQFDEKPASASPVEPDDSSSRVGAFARGAERGALPAAGGVVGAGTGMAAMATTGLPEAALAVPVAGPFIAGGLELAGAAAGGFGGAAAVKTAQDWVLDHAPAGVVKALGLDKEREAADVAAHPNYEFAGELAPNLLAFRPGAMAGAREGATTVEKLMAHPATARALPATIMGAQEAATEKAEGQDLDPTKIAIASGVGAASNKMTRIGHFLTGSGVGPVIGLQAALRNRGKGGEPDVGAMRDITPEGPGPAPAGTPRLPAPIDPQDIQPGDEESPIPTSIIAAGRKVVREATTPVSQFPENAHILEQNGWPKAGTPVTLSDGEGPPSTGVIHSGFETPHPETGEVGHGLNIAMDNGDMFHGFKQEIDAAGVQITPQQLQQAGLPLDLATQAPPAAAVPSVPPMAPATAAPVPAAPRPAGMPVDLFQPRAAAPVPATTGDGTQAAPIVVTHPDHLATAEANVNTAPTEAQAAAGNYEHGHVKVQGLDIAIENPKGSVRRGVDSDGKPWEVTLPASYGYIKRSTAADGEHVDVYVGHNPQSSKVFVVDQKDAKTGAYDEAKSFVGYDTKEQALATYHAAFSDGLGPERMGGIREMNTLQFKKLLNSGVLDKPIAGEFKSAVAPKEITTSANENGPSVANSTGKEITHAPTAFTTARGSTYVVHEDGTTTRDKAARADPGHEGQQGPQPRSQSTFYVTKEHANELGLFQTHGGGAMAVMERPDGTAGVKYLDGNGAGKFEKRTVMKVSKEPAPGLIPVETWKDGTRVHFGNEITNVVQAARPSEKPIVKTARAPLAPSRETSVLENIRRMGGIKTLDDQGQRTKEGQDIHAVLKDVNRPGLINNQTGQRPDTIRESLKAQGWFGSHPEAGTDIQDLYDLMRKEVHEGQQFHPESERGKAAAERAIAESSAHAKEKALAELDHFSKESKEIFSASEKAEMRAKVDRGDDPLSTVVEAIERRAMRDQYEHHAETADPDYAAAIEPDRHGAGEVAGSDGQGSEGHAPVTAETRDSEEAGGPTPAPVGAPSEAKSLATEPGPAVDGQGKPVAQTIVPGAEKSAQQLAKAREASGHGRATTSVEQKDAGGMFAPRIEETQDMFAAPAKVEPAPEPVAAPKPKLVKKQQPKLSIAEKLAQKKPLKEAERRALYDAYFNVGRTVEGYGGKDIVTTAPKWDANGHWTVGVRGLSFNGKETPGERERFHSTAPDTKKLLAFAKSDEFQDGKYVAPATKAEPESDTPAEPKFLPSPDQTATIKGKDFRIVAPQSPEFAAQREAVARALRTELDKIGLHDVGLKIADSLHMEVDGQHADDANGLYWQGVISVALADHPEAAARLNHEVVHAIKDLGLFTKTEWSMLNVKAKSTWRAQFDVDKRWPALAGNEAKLNEEAIAEAYDAFKKESAEKGIIGRLLDRLRNALAAIARGLRGLGFRTEESVFGPNGRDFFRKVASGEVGARRRPLEPYRGVEHEPSFSHAEDHQAALDDAWDNTIAATAKKLGWEGEPTSRAMFAKALLTPKGPAKTELYRNAGIIKTMEDQRASPLRPPMEPFKGTGETKTRGLAAGIEAKAVEKKLTETFGTLPEYQQVKMADQAAKAARFLETNYEAAKAVAMGTEPAPYGVMPESILVAVENRAIREGDTETLRQLATNSALNIEATTMGQRIRALGERDPTSPVAAIKAVHDARQAAAKAKGTNPKKAKSTTVKDMMDAIKKETDKSAKRISWETFINSIACDASGKPK